MGMQCADFLDQLLQSIDDNMKEFTKEIITELSSVPRELT